MGVNYNPKIVTDGLVLALDAANPKSYPGSGTTWTDLSGNANNGTLVNGVGYSSNNQGTLIFDGVNDYVNCGNVLPPSGDFTICSWFSTNFLDSFASIFGTESGLAANAMIMYPSTNFGSASNQTRLFGLNGEILVGSDVRNSGFRNLTLTRSGSIFNLYLEGSVDASGTASGLFDSTFIIGNSYNYGRQFQGNIPITLLYDCVLTEPEIKQNFNATRSRYGI